MLRFWGGGGCRHGLGCFPDLQPSVHALPLTPPIRHRCLSNFAFVCVLSSLFFIPPPPKHTCTYEPQNPCPSYPLSTLFDPKYGWGISQHVCDKRLNDVVRLPISVLKAKEKVSLPRLTRCTSGSSVVCTLEHRKGFVPRTTISADHRNQSIEGVPGTVRARCKSLSCSRDHFL